jgi:hypothetical protein
MLLALVATIVMIRVKRADLAGVQPMPGLGAAGETATAMDEVPAPIAAP